MIVTYRVDWIKDLGDRGENDAFAMYMTVDGKKQRVRLLNIDYFYRMREANNVPEHVSDYDFLTGDPGFQKLLRETGSGHVEFAFAKIEQKKESEQRLEFPADAFEQGSTESIQ